MDITLLNNSKINMPEKYLNDVIRAIEILKASGCTEIYLFGSIAKGEIRHGSDIDIAVKGCSPEQFFPVMGKLMTELEHSVDLINLDRKDDFSKYLQEEGDLLRVS